VNHDAMGGDSADEHTPCIRGSGMKGNWTTEATRWRREYTVSWVFGVFGGYSDCVHKWKGPTSLGLSGLESSAEP